MPSIGEELQRERKQKGLSLSDVEQVLHIREWYLKALEEEDFDAIPGRVYTKGFIRNYANFLGLDGARMVDAYKSHIGEPIGVPKRRLNLAKMQQKEEAATPQDMTLERTGRRLSYEGRKKRRNRIKARERLVALLIVLLMLAFLVWLFIM